MEVQDYVRLKWRAKLVSLKVSQSFWDALNGLKTVVGEIHYYKVPRITKQ